MGPRGVAPNSNAFERRRGSEGSVRAVDDFVAVRASRIHEVHTFSTSLNTSALSSTICKCLVFNNFGKSPLSGSGPGGRWFESTRPDQFFQSLAAFLKKSDFSL